MLGLSSIFLFNFFYMYFATRPRPALTAVGVHYVNTLMLSLYINENLVFIEVLIIAIWWSADMSSALECIDDSKPPLPAFIIYPPLQTHTSHPFNRDHDDYDEPNQIDTCDANKCEWKI